MTIEAEQSGSMSLKAVLHELGFTLVTGVPDSPLAPLVGELGEGCDFGTWYVPGVREDACLAFAAGESLAGGLPLIFMKSAGFAGCLDVATSLLQIYGLPAVLLVSWAGHAGLDVPHHNVIGVPLPELLNALSIPYFRAPIGDLRLLREALSLAAVRAFEVSSLTAVLAIPEGL